MRDGSLSPAWRRLLCVLGGALFAGIFLDAHHYSIREIARTPLVLARLLLDHRAAFAPAIAATIVFALAVVAERRSPSTTTNRIVYASVFGFGLFTLIWFMRVGTGSWGAGSDWNKDWMYYRSIQEAVQQLEMPYYIRTNAQGTERLFANLEAPLAPDTLLLAVMPIPAFYLLRLSCCFAIGFVASTRIKHHLGLSLVWWTLWMVLFVLNGHILSHLGAGHTPWAGYFLVPVIFLALLTLESSAGAGPMAMLALALSAMVAIGSWHIFVWSVIFCIAFAVVRRALVPWIIKGLAITALLSAYRLVPAFLTFGTGTNAFIGSYHDVSTMVSGLIGGALPNTPLGAHEYDLFVGWIGVALLCVALVPTGRRDVRPLTALLAASSVMFVLSLYKIYESTLFRLPGFVSQRVATRMAVLGALGLLLVACRQLTILLPRARLRVVPVAALTLLACAWLAVQLALHAEGLRPATQPVNVVVDVLKNVAVERAYWLSVWSGLAISTVSFAIVLHWLKRRWYDQREIHPHDHHFERRSA